MLLDTFNTFKFGDQTLFAHIVDVDRDNLELVLHMGGSNSDRECSLTKSTATQIATILESLISEDYVGMHFIKESFGWVIDASADKVGESCITFGTEVSSEFEFNASPHINVKTGFPCYSISIKWKSKWDRNSNMIEPLKRLDLVLSFTEIRILSRMLFNFAFCYEMYKELKIFDRKLANFEEKLDLIINSCNSERELHGNDRHDDSSAIEDSALSGEVKSLFEIL